MRPPLAGRQLAPSPSLPMLDMTRRRPPAARRPAASLDATPQFGERPGARPPGCVCAQLPCWAVAREKDLGLGTRWPKITPGVRFCAGPVGTTWVFSLLVVGTISLIASRRHVITFHATVERVVL